MAVAAWFLLWIVIMRFIPIPPPIGGTDPSGRRELFGVLHVLWFVVGLPLAFLGGAGSTFLWRKPRTSASEAL